MGIIQSFNYCGVCRGKYSCYPFSVSVFKLCFSECVLGKFISNCVTFTYYKNHELIIDQCLNYKNI